VRISIQIIMAAAPPEEWDIDPVSYDTALDLTNLLEFIKLEGLEEKWLRYREEKTGLREFIWEMRKGNPSQFFKVMSFGTPVGISRDRKYKFVQVLGSGTYGIAVLVRDVSNAAEAIPVVLKMMVATSRNLNVISTEVTTMKTIRQLLIDRNRICPNFPLYYSDVNSISWPPAIGEWKQLHLKLSSIRFTEQNWITHLGMEFADGGDGVGFRINYLDTLKSKRLKELIQNKDKAPKNPSQIIQNISQSLMFQLFYTMEVFRRLNWLHQDIHPRNIFISRISNRSKEVKVGFPLYYIIDDSNVYQLPDLVKVYGLVQEADASVNFMLLVGDFSLIKQTLNGVRTLNYPVMHDDVRPPEHLFFEKLLVFSNHSSELFTAAISLVSMLLGFNPFNRNVALPGGYFTEIDDLKDEIENEAKNAEEGSWQKRLYSFLNGGRESLDLALYLWNMVWELGGIEDDAVGDYLGGTEMSRLWNIVKKHVLRKHRKLGQNSDYGSYKNVMKLRGILPEASIAALKSILVLDPRKRPTAEDILLRSDAFAEIGPGKIFKKEKSEIIFPSNANIWNLNLPPLPRKKPQTAAKPTPKRKRSEPIMEYMNESQKKSEDCIYSAFGEDYDGGILLPINIYMEHGNQLLSLGACFCCSKRASNLYRCKTCNFATYCSKDCQRKNWNGHKQYCSSIQEM